jgi:hypothetical protein
VSSNAGGLNVMGNQNKKINNFLINNQGVEDHFSPERGVGNNGNGSKK